MSRFFMRTAVAATAALAIVLPAIAQDAGTKTARELRAAAQSFEDDAATSVVVLAGHAQGFSAGFDLKDAEGRERGKMGLGERRAAGFRVGYVDVDPQTHLMDVSAAATAIDDDTFAVVITHLYGRAADVAGLRAICEPRGISVIEDCAQAIGARTVDGLVGSLADLATFSFYPTKNLGGAGDGGMIVTSDPELEEKLRFLRFHGSAGTYSYRFIGYCSRLDEIQAAILRVKMPHLAEWTEARRRNAHAYHKLLAGLEIGLPSESPNSKHVYHQFTIRSKQRDEMRAYLKALDIDTGVFYPSPLHTEQAYRYLGYSEGDFPEAERACREVLSLPVFPELTAEQLEYVASSVRSFLDR